MGLVARCVAAWLQAAHGRISWSVVATQLAGRTDDMCSRAYDMILQGKQVRAPARLPGHEPACTGPAPYLQGHACMLVSV